MTSLEREMLRVLLALELTSTAATQAWNASGGQSGEPDDRFVALVARHDDPPHLTWRAVFADCRNDHERVETIASARAELDGILKRQDAIPDDATIKPLTEVMLEDGKGHDPESVAAHFGVAPAFIRRLRTRNGRHAETGRGIDQQEGLDRPARVRALLEQGLSTRQIAAELKVAQTQVMRWVRDRAA